MNTLEKIYAEKLLRIKAIKLQPSNPFTWASGWKSPFYCDNRKTLSYTDLRNFIKIEFARVVQERFGQVDAIAGVATGAIAMGALVADLLNLPFVYVRSAPKDHGLENLIEGDLRPGMKVVVVEDLISTGGSSLKAVQAIRNNGCEVIGMVHKAICQKNRCDNAPVYDRNIIISFCLHFFLNSIVSFFQKLLVRIPDHSRADK